MQRSTLQNDNKENRCKHIIFVRHGETDWSREDISKGVQDRPLNETGLEQAKNTALFLKTILNSSLNAIMVSSLLKRAIETAREIEKVTGIPISTHKIGLNEFYDYSKIKDLSSIPPKAETEGAFHKRVSETLDELLLEYNQADPLIIVSHQHVFNYLAESLTQHQESLSNAGIASFRGNENGAWELEVLDLKEKAVKLPSMFMQDLFLKWENTHSKNDQQADHERSPSCS
jgi:uncharacterized phosphatase